EYDAKYLNALVDEKNSVDTVIKHIELVTIHPKKAANAYGHVVPWEPPVNNIAKSNLIRIHLASTEEEVEQLEFKQYGSGLDINFDVGIVAGYPLKLPPHLVKSFRLGCFSIHNSLLPKYRGPSPVETAILNEDNETGLTLSEYSPIKEDVGKILAQVPLKMPVNPKRTQVLWFLCELGRPMLVMALRNLEFLKQQALDQNESDASYAKEYNEDFCRIIWEKDTAEEIERKSRAFKGKYFIHTNWLGKKMRRRISLEDYKVNFREESGAERLNTIHERAARRLLNCCQENGGLFIKFGQSIAIQSALLPPPFRKELSVLYDNAPSVPVEQIAPVVEQAFAGKKLGDLFIDFSPAAVASASVAQVHTARLRSDPMQRVAVKVQKPEIRLQIGWDLFALRTCARLIEYAFEVPILWSVSEVEQRLREELDFEREGNNSELANRDLAMLGDRSLQRGIYIPRVFWHATGKQVLTTEWVDGTSLVHPEKLLDEGWAGEEIMHKMVSLFAFQIFVSGNVHGDPHPGNVLVRQHPENNSFREPQLVVLDHGLYVRESREFRRQYTEFWRAAMLGEKRAMARVARNWGMPDADMFSTMVSLKPPKIGRNRRSEKNRSEESTAAKGATYDRHMELKGRAIAALRDSHGLPPELVFVTRNMNIVRANNQSLGIPVDRVQILGQYAALGLRSMLTDEAMSPARRYSSVHGVEPSRDKLASRLGGLLAGQWSYISFRVVLAAAAVGMAAYRLWCRTLALVTGRSYITDMDTILDDAMRRVVERKLGYQIDTSLFSA
ncbi:hypothetical protein LPJ74_003297, partial [Coemansia sp. RSA 1843]